MATSDLTAARLRELFSYDSETGVFIRRVVTSNCVRLDSPVGSLHKDGYVYIGVDAFSHKAHRLAWLHFYGEWPAGVIDHLDGCGSNNRISNLRDATRLINSQNRHGAQSNSKSGLLGVSPYGDRWRAQIRFNGKKIGLGYFKTPQEAYAVYVAAKRTLHEGNML